MTTMTAQTLIAGYETYADTKELTMGDLNAAPALSPVIVFSVASSPECVMFSLGATAASVGTTMAAGC